MPTHPKYLALFEPSGYYHIYNCTNNRERLFLNNRHRVFFLGKYAVVLGPFTETFAWALLDNHFHFGIRVKSIEEITHYLQKNRDEGGALTLSEKKFLTGDIGITELLEFTFKRFFQSYAQSFNREQNRKGNLFARRFKRISIKKDDHLRQTILYIHANAVKHRLLTDFTRYQWSSWHSLLRGEDDIVNHRFVIDLFGGRNGFINTHLEQAKKYFNYVSEMDD